MNIITAEELKTKINNNDDIQIIDIREDYEFEDNNIGGINIPMENVLSSLEQIDTSKQVIICCRTGKRSAAMTHTIERKLNLDNIHSLEGGVFGYLGIEV
ncbi:MAG: NADH oxidase [Flavobacteriales bacterium]|nr:MAG: NADH oxidase [Flavobacteriales bacterium]